MNVLRRIPYGVAALVRPRNAGVILMYHSVSNAKHWSAVDPGQFEEHMRALKEGEFNVVSLQQLAAYRANGSIPPKTICITFDDGYLDNYTIAFPILQRFSFPATIFVITGTISGTLTVRSETFDMMTELQLKELEASGLISIEPHTVNHKKLHLLEVSDAEREVEESKNRLELLLDRKMMHFAYPFGRVNENARQSVRNAGIRYAYTVRPGFVRPGDKDLMLNRNAIDRTTDARELTAIALNGRLSRSRILSV